MKPTIQEIFLQNLESDSGAGMTFIDEPGTEDHLSYKKLYLQACYKLHALQEEGLNPGDELIFQFESNRNFVITFWACVLGRIIPVPVAFASGADTVRKIRNIWIKLNNPHIISDNSTLKATFSEFQDEDAAFGEMLDQFIVFAELKNSKKAVPVPADESDIVFIQFSSGSTQTPKGITNTHEAIIYNFQDYLANIKIGQNDKFLGWVPLIHDMGLIFFHIIPLLSNVPQYLMPPTVFLTYPEIWMESISKYQVTITGCPNFGYRMVLDNLDRVNFKDLVLDQVRYMINSAEPVSVRDCKAFEKAFEAQGLPKNSVRAAYGLAEAVLGVSMNYKNDNESFEYLLDRTKLNVGDSVEIVKAKSDDTGAFANLGTFNFTEITIVDHNDEVLPDRTLGFIRLKSKAITKAYYNDPEISKSLISSDGWLNTGDIGFLDNNDLVITGRAKEMIIINGQNYFPNDLDHVLSELPELNFQQAVACSVFNETTHEDDIFVFVLFKDTAEAFKGLAHEIKAHVGDRLGLEVSQVIPVGQIPKTTSGKIQRYLLRERYLGGEYDGLLADLNDGSEKVQVDQYTPPTTDTERRLVKVWEQYFEVDQIGTEANFYFLGGNSIGLGKLGSLIGEEFNISLDIRKLLVCGSFKDQVKLIEQTSNDGPFQGSGDTPDAASYPLFTTQKRFFAIYQANEKAMGYNIPAVMNVEGVLDIVKCEETFREIIKRHESLRTSFDVIDGTPVQKIHDDFDFEIEVVEDGEANALLKKHMRPFDLSAPPLLRVLVCQKEDHYTKIILDVHHIVVDGASFEVLIQEFQQLYAGETLAPLSLQYRDFVEWNEEKLRGMDLQAQKAFWKETFAEPVEPLKLPTDVFEAAEERFNGETVFFSLNETTEAKLRELCKKARVSMSNATLAILKILLSRLTGSEDIVIGISTLGRWKQEFNQLIGLFTDSLPVRSNPAENVKFSDFLQSVNNNVTNSIENGDYSFEWLKSEKNLAGNDLYNIGFVYYDYDWENAESTDLKLSMDPTQENVVAKMPLLLRVAEKEQGLQLCLDYDANSFSKATAQRFSNYYTEIVKAVIENESIPLGDIEILTEAEKDQLLNVFNDTFKPYDRSQNMLDVFASHVKNDPDQTAVFFNGNSLSYRELDQRANQLARLIVKNTRVDSTLIGLSVDRSIEMIVGIIGILKSGRGYLPLDFSYPTSRLTYMIEDAELDLILTDKMGTDACQGIAQIRLDENLELIDQESVKSFGAGVTTDTLAYVMYTSGSTGRPKGVLVNHGNVVKLVSETGPIAIESTDRVLQWSTFAFDGSVYDIFCSLLNGASLYMMDKATSSDVKRLSAFIKENEISATFFTAALFNVFVDTDIEGLLPFRKVLVGGDRLSVRHVQMAFDLLGPGVVVNGYGPTETTACVASHAIVDRPVNSVPIGKPLDNTQAYVLDTKGNLCGIGIEGELHIGGEGVTMGYLNNVEKTNEKFIENPFRSGSRIYKTGDLVKWLPDGTLDFIGRVDNQVKLRGFRIELPEIEFQLDQLDDVQESVVMIREVQGEKTLVAYYKSKAPIDHESITESLSESLPSYMIPAVFMHMEEFPLTTNGKINRKLLPEHEVTKDKNYISPTDEVEHKLVDIWAEILKINPEVISVNVNYYKYGGDSLNAMILIGRIKKEFKVEITVEELFANLTVQQLKDLVLNASSAKISTIPAAVESEYYPLSSSQQRMYYLYQYDKKSTAYNVPLVLTLNGTLDREKLSMALNQLVDRHENLRTVFDFIEGGLVQRVLPQVDFDIQTLEGGENVSEILTGFLQPFDLGESPLFRVGLKSYSDTEHLLIIDTHHIVTDGVTIAILAKDLFSLYNEESLPVLRIQYKDFAVWEQGEAYQKQVNEQKQYWLDKFSSDVPAIELPYDFPRSKEFDIYGKNHTVELSKKYTDGLKEIAKAEGVTMYTVFLTLYNVLLHKLTRQDDIVIGTPVAGRTHVDLEGITGVFINTLAARNNIDADKSFRDFLSEVNENNLNDLAHQLYPYEDLVSALKINRASGRNPLFDVFLGYQSMDGASFSNNAALEVNLYEDLNSQAKFDLLFMVLDFADKVRFNITYRHELFKPETIAHFMSCFGKIIDQVLSDDTLLLKDINVELEEGFESIWTNEVASGNDEQVVADEEPAGVETTGTSTNETEEKLIRIWSETLNKSPEEIGLDSNFYDLGGASLTMVFLINAIKKEFGIELSIKELIDDPTIKHMGLLIRGGDEVDYTEIPVAEEKDHYPLSSTQKRMYFEYELDQESIAYNAPVVLSIEGNLNLDKLEKAFRQLIGRHDSLRTTFAFVDEEIVQKVLPEVSFSLKKLPSVADLNAAINDFIKPFDLNKSPLIRAGIIEQGDHAFVLIMDCHHIISDGVSTQVLLNELTALYEGQALEQPKLQYKDYVTWQLSDEQQEVIEQHKAYWLTKFEDWPTPLELPVDHTKPENRGKNGKQVQLVLDSERTKQLEAFAKEENTTVFIVLLSIYNLLLSKLSNQGEIVIGSSVAGRSHADLTHVVGAFNNLMVFKNHPKGEKAFKDFLQEVSEKTIEAYEHQDYAYDELITELKKSHPEGQALFNVMFEYFQLNQMVSKHSSLSIDKYDYNHDVTKFDFTLRAFELSGGLEINFEYSTEFFKRSSIQRFKAYFDQLIEEVLSNPNATIKDINMLPEAEIELLTRHFNDTDLSYDKSQNLVSIFEHRVAQHPDRVAIAYEGETLTYKQLDDRANQVANFLTGEGAVPNVVGLLIERSMDMIVGMWGALKVGAGYLPLDPALPEERIRFMLAQSGATFLLTHEGYLDAYSAYLPVQSIDSSKISTQSTECVDFQAHTNDLAYCIFTSGSTGRPKGVMINHGNVINLVKGLEEKVYQSYGDQVLRVALLASYAFDASVQQIFGALLLGHSLYVANDEARKDGVKLKAFFDENEIDVSDGTPTHLRILLNAEHDEVALNCLSSWLLAGEVLSKELVSDFYTIFGEKTQIFNFYGPTETCVDSTSFKIDPKQLDDLNTIPIGQPLPNERVYVTDSNGELVPVGVVGELCIAGDGLAQRYMGDQTLTTEKFSTDWIPNEQRVYRTGDMVRWLPDGNLEYSGRKDNQVKVRGYRIELAEIEKQFNANPLIEHAVVLVRESDGDKYLVAYYQASEKIEVDVLRGYLGKFLPDYMIPNYYVQIDKFDLTLTGKVDHKTLPDYQVSIEDQAVTPPANEVESILADIYAQVLGVDTQIIGRESSFIELGGHSLKMVYLANGIEKAFSVRVSLQQIIKNPVLTQLSSLVEQSTIVAHSHIPLAQPMEYYPLSAAQKGMYFAHELDKTSLSYNVPSAFTLNGTLDKERLTEAFHTLISRHDSLRTEFEIVGGALSQRILPEVDFAIDYIKSDSDLEEIFKDFKKPFDLSSAPLLRVGVVEISDTENVLIMDSHHIISDEVTSSILFTDLSNIYNGENLQEVRVQYKDFVMWQNEAQQQEEIEKQKTYWVDKFSNQIPTLVLPYDFPRSAKNSDNGGSLALPLYPSNREKMKEIALNENLTLYSLYLSVFNVLLHRLSGQKDLIVGTPVAGRPHHELEGITGVFINTLPIRNLIEGDMTFHDFAQQVQKGNAADFDRQLYPYQELVDVLQLKRDVTRNPLFDVSFNYVNADHNSLSIAGLQVEPYIAKHTQSKFDLNMSVIERANDSILFVEYAKGLFQEETVSRFVDYFNAIIEAVCKDQSIKIADILAGEEQENQSLISLSPMVNTNQDSDTIVSVFERQVTATPFATAIKFGDKAYTYEQLNQQVNQLARSFQQDHDIFKGDLVGILLPKSDRAIISILAVLKLGAAYLPIDTSYPIERIKYIVENSGLNALITEQESCSDEIEVDCKVYFEDVALNQDIANLDINIAANDLAYVIYTSGSTGKPKGAMIEHGSNVNMSTDIVKQLDVSDRDTILWFASIGFDASVYEIMMALYSGATLVIPEAGVINDTGRFCSLVSTTETTIMTLPPSYLETLPLDKLTTLRVVTTAGEAANAKKAIDVVKSGIRYFNAYGPTECAVCVSTYEVFRDDEGQMNIPIGKPIANTEIVILDDDLRPVFPGVKGMIYVAGKGVGRGYLNNPELTAKSFIKLPHDDAKTYYNTGDLGEWTPNGQIVFHGRKDNQIKLRGYRIELGEIEGALASVDGVRHCHVTLRESSTGEKELIAFVINNGELNQATMEQDLARLLPEYMIPRTWMQLDEFPVTSNGKIDTSALLALKVEVIDEYQAATGEVETTLVQIWSEVLEKDMEAIGVNDDFFTLGGNSLLAIQVLTAVNKHFGIQLELQEIFKLKTISSLSEFIELNLWVNDDKEEEMEYTETVI